MVQGLARGMVTGQIDSCISLCQKSWHLFPFTAGSETLEKHFINFFTGLSHIYISNMWITKLTLGIFHGFHMLPENLVFLFISQVFMFQNY